MATVSMEEAQARLPELIRGLAAGEELVITEGDQPVAKLIAQTGVRTRPRQPGSAKGVLIVHREDDAYLEDFREYMP